MTLPEGWAEATVGEVAQLLRGVTYRRDQALGETMPGYRPLVRATNIVGGHLITDEGLVYVPENLVKPEQHLRSGDIVLATSSGSLTSVGRSAMVHEDWDGGFGAFCGCLRASSRVDPRYLGYYVTTEVVRRRWSDAAAGTNINNLKRKDLEGTPLPLPPLEQQAAIVKEIEKQFTRLDDAEVSLRHAEARLTAYRAALLRSAVSRDAWEIQPLPEVAENLDRRRVPVSAKEREKRLGSVPYYGATGQVGWIDDYLFDEDLVLLGEDGAPFLDSQASKAYLIRGKAWVNNHAHVLRARRNVMLTEYLALALNAADYHGFVSGTTRLKLTQAAMNRLAIPTPPVAEQRRIINKTEGLLSVAEQASNDVSRSTQESAALRRAILERAFRGDLELEGVGTV